MKWIKGTCLAVVLSLFSGNLVKAGEIEKPAVLEGALATVTVSDLHGLIDGISTVASQISPMMNADMLKGMVGMQIGDPGLTSVPAGKGLAIVALDPETMFAVIEMAEAQMTAITNALAPAGIQFKYSDGMLVVAETAEIAEKGVAQAAAVKASLLSKRSPTLRIALKPSEYVVSNDAQIQGMLAMMPMMLGMSLQQQQPGTTPESVAGLSRMVEGYARIILSLARQVESAEITLTPANGSLRIDEVVEPLAGSRLATMCNAPKVNKWNPKLHSGLLGDGAIKLDICISNPDAISTFMQGEADDLVKVMQLDAEAVKGFMDSMVKWMALYGGTGCEVVQLAGETGFGVDYLMEVQDEAAALELMRSMSEDMAGFTKLYKDMGMPLSFEFKENVREHAGTKIHQLRMNMTMEQGIPQQKAQFEAMGLSNMQYEVAITDGVMAYAMGEGKIEKLIAQIKDPKDAAMLKARTTYPAGASYYCDVNIGEYMAFAASMMPPAPNNPMPIFAAMLKDAEPVTSASYRNNGRLMWSITVPGKLIATIGQIGAGGQAQGGSIQPPAQ